MWTCRVRCSCLFNESPDSVLVGLFFSNEVACAAPKTVIHFLSKVAILFA